MTDPVREPNTVEKVDQEPDGPPPLPPPRPSGGDGASEDQAVEMGLPLRRRDTAVLLLLALLADICLYRSWGGSGGAALMIASIAVLAALKRDADGKRAFVIGAAILALAAVMVWSAWWLAVVMAAGATAVFAVRLWRPGWSVIEALCGACHSVACSPIRLSGHIAACSRRASGAGDRKRVSPRIVLIPLAVTLLFLYVFAAANPVVRSQFAAAWNHVCDVLADLSDYLNFRRFFFWAGWLLVFASLIRPVLTSTIVEAIGDLDIAIGPGDITERVNVNFLAAKATLVCVNVVFLAYNCVDAVYLYIKAALPPGITWTAYTHSGCGWLTFGLFLSSVVLGFIFWNSLNFHPGSRGLKQLAYVWIVQNGILGAGALRRIYMYIDYSGLTHLLITGVYGSLLVIAGLGIMTAKVLRNRNAVWLLRRYAEAFAIGLLALALTPHGLVCSMYNVPRVLRGKPHATWPIVLKELRADALPPLIPLLDYTRPDGDAEKERLVREGIAALLGQQLARLEQEAERPWPCWQASSWWALKRLRAAREKIRGTVPPDRWIEARKRLVQDYDLTGSSS